MPNSESIAAQLAIYLSDDYPDLNDDAANQAFAERRWAAMDFLAAAAPHTAQDAACLLEFCRGELRHFEGDHIDGKFEKFSEPWIAQLYDTLGRVAAMLRGPEAAGRAA